ncbi:hypothetical protein M426DRAFT_16881 [Hypoxylon sp. CI-4A]|nr:hypothetical protein M426DRAFT_16881 [Hypoxylon sp. CI-4A]
MISRLCTVASLSYLTVAVVDSALSSYALTSSTKLNDLDAEQVTSTDSDKDIETPPVANMEKGYENESDVNTDTVLCTINPPPDAPRFHHPSPYRDGEFLQRGMNVEHIELYRPGGFHPVHIGDKLDGKYEVVHKLGNGKSATVWLCHENELQQWKAIKILTASKSSEECPELKFSAALRDSSHRHFWIDGPNGRHIAFVLPVLGPSISTTRSLVSGIDAINGICASLATSLHVLHDRGICHGNLRPSNVLHKMHSIDSLSKEQVWELLGSPYSHKYRIPVSTIKGDDPRPHTPGYLVRSADMRRLQDWVNRDEVAIIGLSNAFDIADTGKAKVSIQEGYAAPEVLLKGEYGLESDIWSLAYIILHLQAGAYFEDSAIDALTTMEYYLGPLPEEYRQYCVELTPPRDESDVEWDWEDPEEDVDEHHENPWSAFIDVEELEEDYLQWKPRELHVLRRRMLKKTGCSDLLNASLALHVELGGIGLPRTTFKRSQPEILQLSDLLRRMLQYRREQRLRIGEVLDHPWMARALNALFRYPGFGA